jgi:hypothetical protein
VSGGGEQHRVVRQRVADRVPTADEFSSDTMDTLITRAPAATAASIPLARSPAVPSLVVLAWRTGKIRASGATPAKPMPDSCCPAMIPATSVPWPTQSVLAAPPFFTSAPASTWSRSRGWLPSTPVSTTPTSTPAPRVSGQTRSKSRRCCAYGRSG